MSDSSPTPEIENEILTRLDRLEALIEEVARALGKRARRHGPEWLSHEEAARLAGTSIEGVRTRIRRERERVDGVSLRVRRGFVHAVDWKTYLEILAERRGRGRGQIARDALRELERKVA